MRKKAGGQSIPAAMTYRSVRQPRGPVCRPGYTCKRGQATATPARNTEDAVSPPAPSLSIPCTPELSEEGISVAHSYLQAWL